MSNDLKLRYLEASGVWVYTIGKGHRESIVELARGSGYFERKFDAVAVARKRGLDVLRDGTVVAVRGEG